jgi:hypothetical protein
MNAPAETMPALRRRQVRPGFLIALLASIAVHVAFSLWPVDFTSAPEDPPLQATITELPPPPRPVVAAAKPAAKPTVKPRRPKASAATAQITSAQPAPVAASEEPVLIAPTPDAIAAGPELPALPVDVATAPEATPPSETSDKTLPPRVDLVYKGFLGTQGFMLGDATYRFEHSGNQYRISTVGEMRGLAALFFPGQGRLESRGSITAAGLLPYEFVFERTRPKRREIALFDWESGIVTLNDQKIAALELPTFDWLAIMWQYYFSPPAGREVSFSVATTRRVARYTITREEDERIEWGQGEIDTVRWRRRSDDGTSDGYVWLAPSLQFIPVKMRYVGPRGTFEALLESIRVDDKACSPCGQVRVAGPKTPSARREGEDGS